MLKKLSIFALVVSLFAIPAIAFAQRANPNQNGAKTNLPSTTTTNTTAGQLQQAKQNLRNQISLARQEYQAKLSTIKDARKQAIVTNIDSRIKTINTNRTNQMLDHLNRLTEILGRISSKSATFKSEGKNTAALNAAILSAQNAINSAQTTVTAQAGKDYVIQITTDAALGPAVKAVLTQFRTDIKAAFDAVVAAHQDVLAAFNAAATLEGTPGITPTVTTTP